MYLIFVICIALRGGGTYMPRIGEEKDHYEGVECVLQICACRICDRSTQKHCNPPAMAGVVNTEREGAAMRSFKPSGTGPSGLGKRCERN